MRTKANGRVKALAVRLPNRLHRCDLESNLGCVAEQMKKGLAHLRCAPPTELPRDLLWYNGLPLVDANVGPSARVCHCQHGSTYPIGSILSSA